jgi:prolyl oligopeptidase
MPLADAIFAPVEEVIHGIAVSDPYRWLEDRNLPETEAWLIDQQKRCETYFAGCGNFQAWQDRVREYLDVEIVDQPARVAGRYFYRRRDRGQEQACIYVRDMTSGIDRRLVDPTAMGPFASIGIHKICADGSLLAFELKHGGEDKKAIQIVDVENGLILPDQIETGYVRGFAFADDRRGFYYCHEPSSSADEHVVCLHVFHTSMADDQVIFRTKRTRGSRLSFIADDLRLGVILVHQENSEDVIDFSIAPRCEPFCWKTVFANRALPYSPMLKWGRIFALSYDGAPNGSLIELNEKGDVIRTVIPARSTTIRQLAIGRNRIYVAFPPGDSVEVESWTLEGEYLGTINVPSNGTIQIFPSEDGFFYTYESFDHPPSLFEYIETGGEHKLLHERATPETRIRRHTERLSFPAKDGTPIPMTLVTQRNGTHGAQPVIMTSYGGFGASMTPHFSVLVSIMLECGATLAVPHIRGGGDLGRQWHEAALRQNRQTAIDDFLAAAEWLCLQGATTPAKLGIFGGSNSGLLVGAAMTQRPDLFQAVLCVAPLLDMVRYERFDQASRWRREYGSVENREEFYALHSYSPYHHLQDGVDYPATLFVSGDKDDRCNPAHVRKTAARLQNRSCQTHPVLVDYSDERGHCPVLPLSVRIASLAKRVAFLCRELQLPLPI